MRLERVALFSSKRDIVSFLGILFTIFLLSISYKYYQYKELIKFDSQIIDAVVLKHYTKTTHTKTGKLTTKYIAKLQADDGSVFYTIVSKKYPHLLHKKLQLEVWAGDISFLDYLTSYFAFSKIITIYPQNSLKDNVRHTINTQHENPTLSALYNALFLATPLPKELQSKLSELGLSHLIAISGFHLGILGGVLFFLFRYPYTYLQERYFPYRNYHRDSFFFVALTLFGYMLFLDMPPSLLRAYTMLVLGFFLYERGYEIISMQTLLVTILLLLALFPKLIFSLGFYLSVAGVFYIFLFAHLTKNLSKVWQFILLPFWVYIMMLPYSITIFGNFSLYHPLSIVWTTLFSIFYPLALLLHLVGHGYLLDTPLALLLNTQYNATHFELSNIYLAIHIIFSLLSIWKKSFAIALLFYSFSLFIYFIYNVT